MTTWITRQEAAARIDDILTRAEGGEDFILTHDGEPVAHLLPTHRDTLAVIEEDIRLGLEDAAAGRVVQGEALVADLMSAYEAAFGHRRTGTTGR